MADGLPEIVAHGPVRVVRFLVLPGGRAPARDFLEELRGNPKYAARVGSILQTARRLAEQIHLAGEQFKYFDENFWEIKTNKVRVLTHTPARSGQLLLVHGFIKLENDAPPREVRAARRILHEYLTAQKPKGT